MPISSSSTPGSVGAPSDEAPPSIHPLDCLDLGDAPPPFICLRLLDVNFPSTEEARSWQEAVLASAAPGRGCENATFKTVDGRPFTVSFAEREVTFTSGQEDIYTPYLILFTHKLGCVFASSYRPHLLAHAGPRPLSISSRHPTQGECPDAEGVWHNYDDLRHYAAVIQSYVNIKFQRGLSRRAVAGDDYVSNSSIDSDVPEETRHAALDPDRGLMAETVDVSETYYPRTFFSNYVIPFAVIFVSKRFLSSLPPPQ